MKRSALLALWLPCLLLSSCDYAVFRHYVDEDYNLRVLQYGRESKTVAVDEYYYDGDKYDGEITIDITIPETINGMPIRHFGRYSTTEISYDGEVKYYHDGLQMNRSSDINFAIICFSDFAEGSVVNINIDIKADLDHFNLFNPYFPGVLEFLNNNDLDDNYGHAPECNLHITIAKDSTKYYSVDGEVFERRDDGEDRKMSTRNPEVSVHGNLWDWIPYAENNRS